ncbi:MAG TPA: hypothetical protein VHY80_17150 [Stellaceae bacterium]|jgi:hypothetical protein|nr:hypothetical protein [Stellaceae bacterium]
MRLIYLGGAAALMLLLGGCDSLYSDHSGEAWRSNGGFTRENPPAVEPPVTGPAIGPGGGSDVGANPSQSAPSAPP